MLRYTIFKQKGEKIRTFIVKNVSKQKGLERWSGRYRRAPSSGSSCLTLPVFYNFAFGKRESRPRQTKVGTDIFFLILRFRCRFFSIITITYIHVKHVYTYKARRATGCSLNIVFFFKMLRFSELCQFCCSAGVLPAI